MPQFIHLADDKELASIERNGIRADSETWSHRGVFAVPVLPSYTMTHQWLRELKRRGMKTLSAVQFFLPAREPVFVGSYRDREPISTTASGAVGIFRGHTSPLGLQSFIPRKIAAKEIRRIYTPSQVAGWRYFPDAHGKPPFCGCPYCQRGGIKNRKIREAYEDSFSE
jgi:hypothetical protein